MPKLRGPLDRQFMDDLEELVNQKTKRNRCQNKAGEKENQAIYYRWCSFLVNKLQTKEEEVMDRVIKWENEWKAIGEKKRPHGNIRQSRRAKDRESIVPRDRQNGVNRAMSEEEKFQAMMAGLDGNSDGNDEGIQQAANEVELDLVNGAVSPFDLPDQVVPCDSGEDAHML